MAKKKVEIALQDEVETQEEWENALQREGLTIIDVYQDWSGPCKAVVGLFRRLKTELNDDLLHFVVAKCDTVEALEKYRGKCEPCFLFFGGGCLVAAVRGVNPPELEKNIIDKLKQEHEVMKGEMERVQIKDPVLLAQELAEAEERRRKEEEEEVTQEVTIAVLKPDVIASGRADDIINELEEKGIEVLQRREHIFTTTEAEEFYEKLKDEPYFNNLVDFMTSGPSEILVCAMGAEGVIQELRGLIGPAIIEDESDEDIKQCIRARYGQDVLRNAIHAADSKEEAAKELAFFYPEFQPPTVRVRRTRVVPETHDTSSTAESTMRPSQYLGFGPAPPGIQRTVALLRPMAYAKYKDEILQRIKEAGFVVAIEKEIQLTKEQAEEYYREHEGQIYYGELITVMTSGPMLALLLARQDAVETWRNMIGPPDVEKAKTEAPESLRAQFISDEASIEEEIDGEIHKKPINLIHGSSDPNEVERDMNFFFPIERTVAAIKPDAYANRDEIIERIKMAGFHVAAKKDTQLSPDLARQLYGSMKDRPFYEELVNHMTSGRTLFLVLTRQDAIAGWRSLMGPTDPDAAAEEARDRLDLKNMSIRATYGRNILANAVHGSSNEQHANETIELIFGDPNVGLPGHAGEEAEQEAEAANELEKEEPADARAQEGAEPDENPKDETEVVEPPPDHEAAEAQTKGTTEALETSAADAPVKAQTETPIESPAEATVEPLSEVPNDELLQSAEPKEEVGADQGNALETTDETINDTVNPPSALDTEAPEDAVVTANENQNQSASLQQRNKSGVSSRSSTANSISKEMHLRSGDTTQKSKKKHSKSSVGSHDSDQDTVLSFTTIDSVSCQCSPYFRPGKRRKASVDNAVRKRTELSVEPVQNKRHKLKGLIRKRNISLH